MGIHRSKAPTLRLNQLDVEERKGEHGRPAGKALALVQGRDCDSLKSLQ